MNKRMRFPSPVAACHVASPACYSHCTLFSLSHGWHPHRLITLLLAANNHYLKPQQETSPPMHFERFFHTNKVCDNGNKATTSLKEPHVHNPAAHGKRSATKNFSMFPTEPITSPYSSRREPFSLAYPVYIVHPPCTYHKCCFIGTVPAFSYPSIY